MADEKKALDTEVEHTFRIRCRGRDHMQRPAISLLINEPVSAEVKVRFRPEGQAISFPQAITLDVKCQYICGAHGGECSAGGVGNYGHCPYSIDLPYAIDNEYGGEE